MNRVEAPFSAAKSNALDDFLGRASLKLRSLSLATCSLSLRASCLILHHFPLVVRVIVKQSSQQEGQLP